MATQPTKAMQHEPILNVYFYRTEAGNEPVREWLKGLEQAARKQIGTDIKQRSSVGRSACRSFASWRKTFGKCAQICLRVSLA